MSDYTQNRIWWMVGPIVRELIHCFLFATSIIKAITNPCGTDVHNSRQFLDTDRMAGRRCCPRGSILPRSKWFRHWHHLGKFHPSISPLRPSNAD